MLTLPPKADAPLVAFPDRLDVRPSTVRPATRTLIMATVKWNDSRYPVLTEADIAAFEHENKVLLPADYRAWPPMSSVRRCFK